MIWALSQQAHPRSRGADATTCPRRPRLPGSSPLARGGHGQDPEVDKPIRLIPARAGRTAFSTCSVAPGPAHPRSRGADSAETGRVPAVRGSSPLARGGPRAAFHQRGSRRLIPARAGRTGVLAYSGAGGLAHPRSRGADEFKTGDLAYGVGSSPLARGGLACSPTREPGVWLIPARAGRTPMREAVNACGAAHPRSRGADLGACSSLSRCTSSSPLARGGPPVFFGPSPSRGLIPARAGRTTANLSMCLTHRAHPRSRGADVPVGPHHPERLGSSPLARGGHSRS